MPRDQTSQKPPRRLADDHPQPARLRAASLIPALVLGLSAAMAAAEGDDPRNWPSYRGSHAQGVALDAKLPTSWDVESGENIVWKTAIPGLGHSSPVVWGDRIYLTTAVDAAGESDLKVGLYGDIESVSDEGSIAWTVLALDRLTGKILWQRVAHQGIPKVKRHTKASHANSTPATDGQRVVAMFGSEGLHAYDTSGELLWRKDFGVLDSGFFKVPEAQWGFASSPVIHDGRVLVQVDVQKDSFLAAFDVATGDELWRTPREEVPTWGSPTVAPRPGGKPQIVVNGWKHIGGYDFATGKELWRLTGGGDIPVPTPIVAGDLVLITSAHGDQRPIYAIRLDAKGEIDGTEQIAWTHDKAGNYMQTPIVVSDVGYFCLDNGVLSAYEVKTGERLYQQRLARGSGGFTASPVATREQLYFTSESGDVYVLKPGKELVELARNELGETFMSTPAISGDLLLFRARRHLIAVGHTAEKQAEEQAKKPTPSADP